MSNRLRLVRMWVTEGCNAFCHFCMNARSRTNASMSFEKAIILYKYFNQNGFDTISIMGGEPTIHPQFTELVSEAQLYFETVYLFTNGINRDVLETFNPRESDSIIYNFNFSSSIQESSLLLSKPGNRLLDVVINYDCDVDKITKELIRVISISPQRITTNLVINNSTNIFVQKKSIIDNINKIYNALVSFDGFQINLQCSAPLCFTYGEKLPPFTYNAICPDEAVLVDSNYNACFCNLYTNNRIQLFQSNSLLPFKILRNHLLLRSLENRQKALKKICKDCLYFNVKCNGKCHIAQDFITSEDIINNTKIPWLKTLM